jgi:hypothetical protein
MDRTRAATRSTDLTVVLGVLGLLLAAAAIWAGTSFAGGSSGSGNSPSQGNGGGIVQSDEGKSPGFVQDDGDCPERNGNQGQNGEPSPEDSL